MPNGHGDLAPTQIHKLPHKVNAAARHSDNVQDADKAKQWRRSTSSSLTGFAGQRPTVVIPRRSNSCDPAMLTPDQVLPFLMHEKSFVRAHAIEYFHDASCIGALTAAGIVRAHHEELLDCPHLSAELPDHLRERLALIDVPPAALCSG